MLYGINVIKPRIHGMSLTIVDEEFSLPDKIFGIVNDANVKEGYQVSINSLYNEMNFEFQNGQWTTIYSWTRDLNNET